MDADPGSLRPDCGRPSLASCNALPDDYQPPLTRWGHAWRLVGMALISGAVWGPIVQAEWQDHRALFWLDVALGLVCYVLVFWRRRWPLAIALVTGLLSTCPGRRGPAVLAAVSLATRRRMWELAASPWST